MQRRRFLGLTAAGAAVAASPALTACGGSGGSDHVTLSLVAADYGDKAANSSQNYWGSLARAFEREHHDISVDVDVYSWTEVDQKVAEMVRRGKAPDIAQIGAYADYAAAGKLYRADEMLSISTQAAFIPTIAHAGEVRRVQYGLPFAASTRLLFYNKDLFDRAGVSSAPRSWTELRDVAVKLKQNGVRIPYGLPLGPEEAPAETLMWLLSGGGGYTDGDGHYMLDDTENVRTLEWLRDELVGEGLTGPKPPAKVNRRALFAAFARGEVGMLNGHPTLMQQVAGRGFSYGMAPLPGINGRAKATLGVADWLMAFRQHGHREEAGHFLDFVYRRKNVLDFSAQYDLLPVTTAASEAMRGDKKYRRLWQFLDELTTAEFYPSDKTSWAAVSETVKKKIGGTVVSGGDPAGLLRQLQREAEAKDGSRD